MKRLRRRIKLQKSVEFYEKYYRYCLAHPSQYKANDAVKSLKMLIRLRTKLIKLKYCKR